MNNEINVQYFNYGAYAYRNGERRQDREDAVPFEDVDAKTSGPIFFDCHCVLGEAETRVCMIGTERLYILYRSNPTSCVNPYDARYVVSYVDCANLVPNQTKIIDLFSNNVKITRQENGMIDLMFLQLIDGTVICWSAVVGYEYGAGWTDDSESF